MRVWPPNNQNRQQQENKAHCIFLDCFQFTLYGLYGHLCTYSTRRTQTNHNGSTPPRRQQPPRFQRQTGARSEALCLCLCQQTAATASHRNPAPTNFLRPRSPPASLLFSLPLDPYKRVQLELVYCSGTPATFSPDSLFKSTNRLFSIRQNVQRADVSTPRSTPLPRKGSKLFNTATASLLSSLMASR